MTTALLQIFMSLHSSKCIKGRKDANNRVFLVTRSLLRSKEQDVKDFKLNGLCERYSQKKCQILHSILLMNISEKKEK
jgi:hypothetical protein